MRPCAGVQVCVLFFRRAPERQAVRADLRGGVAPGTGARHQGRSASGALGEPRPSHHTWCSPLSLSLASWAASPAPPSCPSSSASSTTHSRRCLRDRPSVRTMEVQCASADPVSLNISPASWYTGRGVRYSEGMPVGTRARLAGRPWPAHTHTHTHTGTGGGNVRVGWGGARTGLRAAVPAARASAGKWQQGRAGQLPAPPSLPAGRPGRQPRRPRTRRLASIRVGARCGSSSSRAPRVHVQAALERAKVVLVGAGHGGVVQRARAQRLEHHHRLVHKHHADVALRHLLDQALRGASRSGQARAGAGVRAWGTGMPAGVVGSAAQRLARPATRAAQQSRVSQSTHLKELHGVCVHVVRRANVQHQERQLLAAHSAPLLRLGHLRGAARAGQSGRQAAGAGVERSGEGERTCARTPSACRRGCVPQATRHSIRQVVNAGAAAHIAGTAAEPHLLIHPVAQGRHVGKEQARLHFEQQHARLLLRLWEQLGVAAAGRQVGAWVVASADGLTVGTYRPHAMLSPPLKPQTHAAPRTGTSWCRAGGPAQMWARSRCGACGPAAPTRLQRCEGRPARAAGGWSQRGPGRAAGGLLQTARK